MLPKELDGVISEDRWDRLIYHLIKAEKLTGSKCRTKPRKRDIDCPIALFAPDFDSHGRPFDDCGYSGKIYYDLYVEGYKVYESSDGAWWVTLPCTTRNKIIKSVSKYLKKGNAI